MAPKSKSGTYKASTSPTATAGTSSAANRALQQSLVANGAKISVDGKYGPATAAAVAQYGGTPTPGGSGANGLLVNPPGAAFDRNTGNPIGSSTPYRAETNALGADISGLTSAYASDNAFLEQQRSALAERRVNEVAGIKTEFDIAKIAQEVGQKRDYGARATSLITSGGGFLGATQSQEGVLQNLKGTFDAEKTALMSKREAAILAAKSAFEDKDFAFARELSKNARDLQKEIYGRQKDFAEQQLAVTKESRAQTEFDVKIAKDKIEAYTKMSDEQFKSINPSEFSKYDSYYYPGYTAFARDATKKADNLKTQQDQVDLDYKIHSARLSTDVGKTFKLGGVTYTGMKTKDASSGTQADRDMINKQRVQSWFTSATKIPGTDGIPFVDSTGYATPEGWQTAYEYSGMDRRKFIQEYSYLLRQSGKDSESNPLYPNYGLTPSEMKLVNTVIPVNY